MTHYQTPERILLKFNAIKEPEEFWEGKRVLDIGCCEGMLYPLLISSGVSEYVGIDNSPEYIWESRKNFPDAKFILTDLRDYRGYADIGIALSTLHIFDDNDFDIILKQYSRQCKILIFEVPVEGSAPIYYTRSKEKNIEMASKYFRKIVCYGTSPSPHDIQSTRKVFKCEN
jgi:SAM-dependent methyltransferase